MLCARLSVLLSSPAPFARRISSMMPSSPLQVHYYQPPHPNNPPTDSLSYTYGPKSPNLTHSLKSGLSSKMKKVFSLTMAFLFLIFTSSYLQASMAGSAFCDGKCKVRCSKASARDNCLRYCGLCCEECHCVPSGTYGNKDECPCYRDKMTGVGKRRRPKCP